MFAQTDDMRKQGPKFPKVPKVLVNSDRVHMESAAKRSSSNGREPHYTSK